MKVGSTSLQISYRKSYVILSADLIRSSLEKVWEYMPWYMFFYHH